MIRAFAPVLAHNGGGAILNVLSAAAWMTVDGNTAYAAAKSAEWGLTNGVRVWLAGQGTQVSALVPGLIATQTLLDYAAQAGVELPPDAMNDPSISRGTPSTGSPRETSRSSTTSASAPRRPSPGIPWPSCSSGGTPA